MLGFPCCCWATWAGTALDIEDPEDAMGAPVAGVAVPVYGVTQ